MSTRQCGVCGKTPADGHASVYANGVETWYCHGDDGPSCYERANTDAVVTRHGVVMPGAPIVVDLTPYLPVVPRKGDQ